MSISSVITLSQACQTGSLEKVQSAIKKNAKPTKATLDWAILSGNLDIVKAVIEIKAPPSETSLDYAISQKSLPILQAVTDAGAQPKPSSLTYAIKHSQDNFDIVKHVYGMGAPLDEESLNAAIKKRFDAFVSYLLDGYCKPNSETFNSALESSIDNANLLKIVIAKGVKPNPKNPYVLTKACELGLSLEVIEIAVNAGAKADANSIQALLKKDMCKYVSYNYIEKLKLLIQAGAKASDQDFELIEKIHKENPLAEKERLLQLLEKAKG